MDHYTTVLFQDDFRHTVIFFISQILDWHVPTFIISISCSIVWKTMSVPVSLCPLRRDYDPRTGCSARGEGGGKGGAFSPSPPPPRPSLPSMKVLQKTDYLKHEAGSDLMGTVVIKRQRWKWMNAIESKCRSAVEDSPSCDHLNESEGDQTKRTPIAHLQFK